MIILMFLLFIPVIAFLIIAGVYCASTQRKDPTATLVKAHQEHTEALIKAHRDLAIATGALKPDGIQFATKWDDANTPKMIISLVSSNPCSAPKMITSLQSPPEYNFDRKRWERSSDDAPRRWR